MSAPVSPASVATIQAALEALLPQPAVEKPLRIAQGVTVDHPGRWAGLALNRLERFACQCAELEKKMAMHPWFAYDLAPAHERLVSEAQEIYRDALTLRAELEKRETYG